MDELSSLLIDKKTEERFHRMVKSVLKKNRFAAERDGAGDYYTVSDGNDTIGVDVSPEKYRFARTHDPACADSLADRIKNEFYILSRLVSFTNGQEFLRYTVMRQAEVPKGVISESFMGGLKKVICYTGDDILSRPLSDEYIKKWDVPREVLFSVADRNMCRLLRKASFTENALGTGEQGIRCLDFKAEGSDFTVALMMCADFRNFVAEKLCPKFLAAAPSKDTLIVMNEITNDVLERLGPAIVGEYRWASRPLTTDIFLYTSSGVEIAGHFSEAGA